MERLSIIEIKDLIQAGKEGGLSYLDCYGVTLHFSKSPIKTLSPEEINRWSQRAPTPKMEVEEAFKDISSVDDDLSDEELVKFYATPYFDELKAEKEDRKAQIKEGSV